ncbi:hypothetical protein L7F22_033540 [Adiantum nelumboides]|nr:hypothetical protein [Adiantum nelumboides]
MEISSYAQDDEDRFTARTLSDISIASNASGKVQTLSSFGAPKHVRDTRVKFLCSHGGKILPRPSDKTLRYVGGDTRIISVPRHIQLAALRVKLAEVYGHDVTCKYQLPEEDLDALVSVSSDEDLDNMMEECDRLDGMEGSSKLRVFVFSSSDHDTAELDDVIDPKFSEHQYVEAVNAVQADMSSRQSDNLITTDLYKNSLGFYPGYVWNTAFMQERLPLRENLHSQVYPLEQFTTLGSYPVQTLPQKNNFFGHIAAPSHTAVTKQRIELASSLHANNISSQGIHDFLDLESGESASSSASSQHDLYHQSRWNSNSQIQFNTEQTAYRSNEDQMLRAESRGQEGALLDSNAHEQMTAHLLPASGQIYGLNTTENKNFVHEDQPLSPGALLQRQLQANHLETDISRTFGKQGFESCLDGYVVQATQVFPLSHERKQFEQLPAHHPESDIIQGGLLAGVQLLSEPLKIPGKVHLLTQEPRFSAFPDSDTSTTSVHLEITEKPAVLSQQIKLQEASVYPAVLPDVNYPPYYNHGADSNVVLGLGQQPFTEAPLILGPQSNNANSSKVCELDGLKQHMLLSKHTPAEHSPTVGLDFGIGSQASWLAPDLVSFPPPRDTSEVDTLDQIKHHTKIENASRVTANGGLSLLDAPVDYNDRVSSAAVLDAKVDLASAVMGDCSTRDILSDLLPSATVMNCYSASKDTLVATLARLGKEEVSLLTVTTTMSELSLERISEDIRLGPSHGADSLEPPFLQEIAAFSKTDEPKTDICKKGIVEIVADDIGAAINGESEDLLHKEVHITVGPREHEQIHVNYEQDAVELDSCLIVERDLTNESSRLELEEGDVFNSSIDKSMNTAAIAEAEAIARGLQTIRNFDLEELRELGSGTFGTVYHGKWRGTDVAIKRIKSSCFTGRPSERERLIADFWQEAFILGQLHHPNVVAFYGVVPDGPDGTLATVTEYMVNGSLKQALQKKDRIIDRHKRLIIAMDAAFGMEYLHKKNVVHFDLKCENLLVNLRDIQRPICKVGDLGLSKVKQQTMISGGVRGTLPWMAPELLNGSSSLVSEKVDVFSFGIVLWELLTGEEPYASMHYGAIIGGIVTNTLRPPVPRWCDAAWKSLMETCWAADPAERPTFTEIANSLRAMEATVNGKGQDQAQSVE